MEKKLLDENTEFDTWYGKDFFDKDVSILDETLLQLLQSLSKTRKEGHDHELYSNLFEHALKENYITLPDGARFVNKASAAKEQNWLDIYDLLMNNISEQNLMSSEKSE